MPNRPDDWFSADELARARRYQRPVTRARILRTAITTVVMLVLVFADVAPELLDSLDVTNWVVQLVVVVLLLEVVSMAIGVPFEAWLELRHDKEWELSTQTGAGFVSDLVKGTVLGLVINVVLF
ncbi:MAG TPA: hypothetical protein VD926_08670, partial [Acidimicrobiales bacterium]|nr:hypothetical protein [Acidimicrobiales bacterium]